MRRRRVVLLAALAGLAYMRRTKSRRREQVDLFFEDGSVVTLAGDEAKPLVDVARSIL